MGRRSFWWLGFALSGLFACGPAPGGARSASGARAHAPAPSPTDAVDPAAAATSPDAAKGAPAATEDDRFADCQALMALEMKHEARYLWAGFDGVAETQATLTRKAADYEAIGVLSTGTLAAAREFAAAYRESASRIASLHEAIKAAQGDDVFAAQRNLLEAHSPTNPRQQVAAACAGVQPPAEHNRRVSCALLAGASYTSARFAVVGNDQRAGAAIAEVARHAAGLGPDAAPFAKAQRARHDALSAAAARFLSAPAPEQNVLQTKRVALLISSVEATSRELRQICPGMP